MARERAGGENGIIELAEADNDRTSYASDSHDVAVIEAPPEKALYLKLISSGFSFFVAGVNDGSLGTLIPYLMLSYRINPGTVAAM